MATPNNFCAVRSAFLVVFASVAVFVPVDASDDSKKTVTLDIRPGGVVQTFTEGIVSDCIENSLYFYD